MSKKYTTIIIIGPCGAGKTMVGSLLAKALERPFLEGDDFHAFASKEKMRLGIPLTDDDRWPWLKKISLEIGKLKKQGGCCVACSALKKSYRDILRQGDDDLLFVFLKGDKDIILKRMNNRKDHYMKSEMLDSQLSILEAPTDEKDAIVVDIDQSPENICQTIIKFL